jgi:hypothetical protein
MLSSFEFAAVKYHYDEVVCVFSVLCRVWTYCKHVADWPRSLDRFGVCSRMIYMKILTLELLKAAKFSHDFDLNSEEGFSVTADSVFSF